MRRTIHADPKKAQRNFRRDTRSILPSNFQFTLEDKAEEVEVKRSSDGQLRQMVDKTQYKTLQKDFLQAQKELVLEREKSAKLEEELFQAQADIQTLAQAVGITL